MSHTDFAVEAVKDLCRAREREKMLYVVGDVVVCCDVKCILTENEQKERA